MMSDAIDTLLANAGFEQMTSINGFPQPTDLEKARKLAELTVIECLKLVEFDLENWECDYNPSFNAGYIAGLRSAKRKILTEFNMSKEKNDDTTN